MDNKTLIFALIVMLLLVLPTAVASEQNQSDVTTSEPTIIPQNDTQNQIQNQVNDDVIDKEMFNKAIEGAEENRKSVQEKVLETKVEIMPEHHIVRDIDIATEVVHFTNPQYILSGDILHIYISNSVTAIPGYYSFPMNEFQSSYFDSLGTNNFYVYLSDSAVRRLGNSSEDNFNNSNPSSNSMNSEDNSSSDNTGDNSSIPNSYSQSSGVDKDNGVSSQFSSVNKGIPMEHTGIPILVLLISLITLPLSLRRK